MRIAAIITALFLTQFGNVYACEQLPAAFKVNALSGEFSTLTGNYTVNLAFKDLANAECTVSRNGSVDIKDAATVKVVDRSNGKTVQTYSASMAALGTTAYLGRPAHMVTTGITLQLNSEGVMFINVNGAAMRANVQ